MRQIITSLGRYMASPFAFLILFGYGALWFLYKPETFEWHAGATLATWFMTLVIQRAEHRDTQAIHAKLDEMLHVMGEARNELTRVDEKKSRNAGSKCARTTDGLRGSNSHAPHHARDRAGVVVPLAWRWGVSIGSRSRFWDLLANDYAATCPDASFDDAISARR